MKAIKELFTQQHHKVLYSVLRTRLSPKQSQSILSLWRHWERHHGAQFLIDKLAQYAASVKGVDSCVSCTSRGVWKGPMKALFPTSRKATKFVLRVCKLTCWFKATVTSSDYVREAKRLSVPEIKLDPLYFPLKPVAPSRKVLGPIITNKSPSVLKREVLRAPGIFLRYKSLFMPYIDYWHELSLAQHIRSDIVGSFVLLTKDGKLKKRGIFSPHPFFQSALEPLYRALRDHCRGIPNMFHEDQAAGLRKAIELSQRGTMLTVDIKSASDNIPFQPQVDMLLKLFPHLHEEIGLFSSLARSSWLTPTKSKIIIRMMRGQPMGVKPSFLSFSLFLNLLLREVISVDDFVQVGDDLFCVDGYDVLPFLQDIGIPISHQKSYYGNIGDFVGTSFDRRGDLHTVSAKNWLDLSRMFKKKLLKYSPTWQYFVAGLPAPIGEGYLTMWPDVLPMDLLLRLFLERERPDINFFVGRKMPIKVLKEYAEQFMAAFNVLVRFARQYPHDVGTAFDLANWQKIILDRRPYISGLMPKVMADSANTLLIEGASTQVIQRHLNVLSSIYNWAPDHDHDQELVIHEPLRSNSSITYEKKLWNLIRPFIPQSALRRKSMSKKDKTKSRKSQACPGKDTPNQQAGWFGPSNICEGKTESECNSEHCYWDESEQRCLLRRSL